jgi:hypothetical protein
MSKKDSDSATDSESLGEPSTGGRGPHLRGDVALAIGLAAACAFVGIAGINISAQGLYYDEIHQAPAAFAYRGKWAPFFSVALVSGKPLMTMAYSGAIKSALYGLYLLLSGAPFTVESWRWLGIALVAVTFPLFAVLACRRLSPVGLSIFFALLVTDATVLLETRHDWGPAALALAIRMLFLGTWLHGEADGEIRPRNSFWLGAIVGFSIYEKLSNVVLLLPLWILLLNCGRRKLSHWRACIAGGIVGGLPLLFANAIFFAETGQILSTSQIAARGTQSLASLVQFVREYLALGDGALVRRFILGEESGYGVAEAILLSVALVSVLGSRRSAAARRAPAILVACYLAIAAALFLLPNLTWAHHWVIGTPFQYLAIALAIGAPARRLIRRPVLGLTCRFSLLLAVAILMMVRAQGTLALTHALARGASSETWDPSLTRLGELSAKRAGQDLFVAGNWGIATQVYCLSNGHPRVVRELDAGRVSTSMEKMLRLGRFRSIYLVLNARHMVPGPAVTRPLVAAFEEHANLREVPVEEEMARLAAVKVRKFVYSDHVLR